MGSLELTDLPQDMTKEEKEVVFENNTLSITAIKGDKFNIIPDSKS